MLTMLMPRPRKGRSLAGQRRSQGPGAVRPMPGVPAASVRGWSRRTFLFRSVSAIALAGAQVRGPANCGPRTPLDELEAQLGGRIGVVAIDTGSGARIAHREAERFAMCSTFKWILAGAVLDQDDRSGAILERRLSFGPQDLLAHSPVTEEHLAEGSLTIAELCKAAVEASDNTAANTLLRFIGGPAALTRYLRKIGDPSTRLDRIEPSLNSNLRGDPRDTTTPNAMLATMHTLLIGNALSAASRETLLLWMKNCETGRHRLRAGLPSTWTAGDKTGTGDRGAANDDAIVWPPQRSPILVAAYLSDSRAAPQALDAAHERIGRIVASTFS